MKLNAPDSLPNDKPLTQAELDKMDFDKVWISYGPEPDNGEWALVYNGLLYSIDDLEGAGFEDMLNDLMRGDALDNPSGTYRVYRFPLKEFRNTLPDSPLTMEQLREMDKPTPVQIPADKIDGNGLRVYAYHPNHIDWEQWVSVDDHLPPEHDSIFKKMVDAGKWADGMFKSMSDDVIVSVRFSDGTKKTGWARTKDGHWVGLPVIGCPVVTHWMPFPEPPVEEVKE